MSVFEDIVREEAGGAAGAPETEAAGSQTDVSEEALNALQEKAAPPSGAPDPVEAEFLKRLESIDPEKLPDSLRKKLELPFLQMTSKKINEEVEKRDALYRGVIEKLTKSGVDPNQDQRNELLERARSGDGEATMALVEKMVAERVGPMEAQLAADRAVREAYAMNPLVKEREPEIEQFLATAPEGPALKQIMRATNFQTTPMILSGIANTLELRRLQADVGAKIAAAEKAAVEKYKNEVRSAPATTSRAGGISSRPVENTGTAGQRFLEELRKSGIEPTADLLRRVG